jgi:hypothetical protein
MRKPLIFIPCGGQGNRIKEKIPSEGVGISKVFDLHISGKPLLYYTLKHFTPFADCDHVFAVTSEVLELRLNDYLTDNHSNIKNKEIFRDIYNKEKKTMLLVQEWLSNQGKSKDFSHLVLGTGDTYHGDFSSPVNLKDDESLVSLRSFVVGPNLNTNIDWHLDSDSSLLYEETSLVPKYVPDTPLYLSRSMLQDPVDHFDGSVMSISSFLVAALQRGHKLKGIYSLKHSNVNYSWDLEYTLEMDAQEKDLLLSKISNLKLSLKNYWGVGADLAWENYVLAFLRSHKVEKMRDLDVLSLKKLLFGLESLVKGYTNQA